jgi:nucleoid DNA-binding protein
MKKSELAKDLARQNGVRTGNAADELDLLIHQIIRTLRGGQPARLPGLGTITPGKQWTFLPEKK